MTDVLDAVEKPAEPQQKPQLNPLLKYALVALGGALAAWVIGRTIHKCHEKSVETKPLAKHPPQRVQPIQTFQRPIAIQPPGYPARPQYGYMYRRPLPTPIFMPR
jgi:hypothetical protein